MDLDSTTTTTIPLSVSDELVALVNLAWPAMLISLAFSGIGLINAMVIGHLGTKELSAVAFSDCVMEFTLLIFLQGFNQGVRALCSQAFGASNHKLVGTYTHVALVGTTLSCLPLGLVWYNVGSALSYFESPSDHGETVALVTLYSRLSLLSLFPRLIFSILATSFMAQQIVLPTATITTVFLMLHAPMVYVGVFGIGPFFQGYGFIGCPLATTITLTLRLIVYVTYMARVSRHRTSGTWSAIDLSAMKTMAGPLLLTGGPLMLGSAFESGQLQVAAAMAAHLGAVPLAAHSSMLTLFFTLTSPIYGLTAAAITRIGFYLGADQPRKAQQVSLVLLGCVFSLALLVVVFFISTSHVLGSVFSTDLRVERLIGSLARIAASGYFFLSFFYYSMATLTAQSRPLPILGAFFLGAWIVGVPCAYFLAPIFGVWGIWVGLAAGYGVTTLLGVTATRQSDWTLEAKRARRRAQPQDKQQLPHSNSYRKTSSSLSSQPPSVDIAVAFPIGGNVSPCLNLSRECANNTETTRLLQ